MPTDAGQAQLAALETVRGGLGREDGQRAGDGGGGEAVAEEIARRTDKQRKEQRGEQEALDEKKAGLLTCDQKPRLGSMKS